MSQPFLTLGSITDLWSHSYAGFDYPPAAQSVDIISDGTSLVGNEVVQSSGYGFRRATFAGTFKDVTEMATVRGYYEAQAPVSFTDYDEVVRTVVILAFSARLDGPVWVWTMTLLEESVD